MSAPTIDAFTISGAQITERGPRSGVSWSEQLASPVSSTVSVGLSGAGS